MIEQISFTLGDVEKWLRSVRPDEEFLKGHVNCCVIASYVGRRYRDLYPGEPITVVTCGSSSRVHVGDYDVEIVHSLDVRDFIPLWDKMRCNGTAGNTLILIDTMYPMRTIPQ